ncbi:Berberine/berberine-like protein [Artemisia annua]|uniref:Berberine/berberine-like protein n=1 Tax=Artemisia annua TaxID=35608 RepID=A0A2U1NA85_ARTAN|nr:Berberine/berberine-like protein [Artemisia annua]
MPSNPKPDVTFIPLNEKHIQTAVICVKKNLGSIFVLEVEAMTMKGYVPFKLILMIILFGSKVLQLLVNSITELLRKVIHTHGIVAGIYTSLGIAGHITGGAYGSMMRKYGLGVNNTLDAKIINANGEIFDRKTMGRTFSGQSMEVVGKL